MALKSWVRGYWIDWKPNTVTSERNDFNSEVLVTFDHLILAGARNFYVFEDELNLNNSKIVIPSFNGSESAFSLFNNHNFYYNLTLKFTDIVLNGSMDFAILQLNTNEYTKVFNCSIEGKAAITTIGRTSFGFL